MTSFRNSKASSGRIRVSSMHSQASDGHQLPPTNRLPRLRPNRKKAIPDPRLIPFPTEDSCLSGPCSLFSEQASHLNFRDVKIPGMMLWFPYFPLITIHFLFSGLQNQFGNNFFANLSPIIVAQPPCAAILNFRGFPSEGVVALPNGFVRSLCDRRHKRHILESTTSPPNKNSR